jgi:hypothetical protein
VTTLKEATDDNSSLHTFLFLVFIAQKQNKAAANQEIQNLFQITFTHPNVKP